MDVMHEWDFARFEFEMGFGRISHISQGPRDVLKIPATKMAKIRE